jgi:NADPH:quinone reductase-like Zn-dependent oxidoreductase
MRGVIQAIPGDPLSLYVAEVPMPHEPGPRDVLIRVQYAAINRADLLMAKGFYLSEHFLFLCEHNIFFSFILPNTANYPSAKGASNIIGLEIAGSVIAVGEQCQYQFEIGDAVIALVPGGGYAEFCLCDERTVIKSLSPELPLSVQAAVPEAYMTAYQLCFFVAKIQQGESVLVHAAASSVGLAIIQILSRKGVKVFATARTQDKVNLCEDMGAQHAFNLGSGGEFSELIRSKNDSNHFDVVLDPVGASYLDQNIDILGTDGRLVLYGTMGGSGVSDSNFLSKLMAKRIQLLSTTLKTRSVEYKHELIKALSSDPAGFPAIASKDITVLVDRIYPLDQVLEAHAYMGKNQNIGKILLSVNSTTTAIEFFEKELEDLQKRLRITAADRKTTAAAEKNSS